MTIRVTSDFLRNIDDRWCMVVVSSCREMLGYSADSSIRDVVPNDIASLLKSHSIRAIFTNGKTAQTLYDKHIFPTLGVSALCLPSTSPANAAWSAEKLVNAWRVVII